jgi:hypothetical protein
LERYETLVEVANGGVTHVSHRGRTRVHIRDLFQTNHSALVTLNNVLYVPGLTRRLISVVEWNSCGGHILFLKDRIQMEIFNDDGSLMTSIDVAPIYTTSGMTQLNSATHLPIIDTTTRNLTKVTQSLLHRRLGHRSIYPPY